MQAMQLTELASGDCDSDDTTLPGVTVPPCAPITRAAQRFVACDAQLRLGTNRGCLAIGLYEARHVCASRDPRLIILVVWRSALREPGVGRYRIQPQAPAEDAFGVLAYLTYGDEWRCFEASRATEGRIAISTISEASVAGAFDVTFASGRFHGTFLAELRDRRACFEGGGNPR